MDGMHITTTRRSRFVMSKTPSAASDVPFGVGYKFRKHWEGFGWYTGTVEEVHAGGNNRRLRYDDGSSEVLSIFELFDLEVQGGRTSQRLWFQDRHGLTKSAKATESPSSTNLSERQIRSSRGTKVAVDQDGEALWAIKHIIGRRFNTSKRCVEYLIVWRGYENDPSHNTWEPDNNLCAESFDAVKRHWGETKPSPSGEAEMAEVDLNPMPKKRAKKHKLCHNGAMAAAKPAASDLHPSSNEDNAKICPLCCEEYDDDPDNVKYVWSSRLPIQSSGCQHKICCSCVTGSFNAEGSCLSDKAFGHFKWLRCPYCRKNTCFNARQPIVDTGHCSALRRLRASEKTIEDYEAQIKEYEAQIAKYKAQSIPGPDAICNTNENDVQDKKGSSESDMTPEQI